MYEKVIIPIIGAIGAILASLPPTCINFMCFSPHLVKEKTVAPVPSPERLVDAFLSSDRDRKKLSDALRMQNYLYGLNERYDKVLRRYTESETRWWLAPAIALWIGVAIILFSDGPWWITLVYFASCAVLSFIFCRDNPKDPQKKDYESYKVPTDASIDTLYDYLKSLYGDHGEAYMVQDRIDVITPDTGRNVVEAIRLVLLTLIVYDLFVLG